MSASAPGETVGHVSFERERGVYQVQVTEHLAHAVVAVKPEENRNERIQQLFDTLRKNTIPIFLIKLHSSAVTFAVDSEFLAGAEKCVKEAGFTVQTRTGLALLTINASSMRDLSGVMVNIADSLAAAGARLYGVGDSHNSVQCLIDGQNVDAAVSQIKKTFGLPQSSGGSNG